MERAPNARVYGVWRPRSHSANTSFSALRFLALQICEPAIRLDPPPNPWKSRLEMIRSSLSFVIFKQVALATLLICAAFFPGDASAEELSFLSPQGPVASAQRDHFIAIILLVFIVAAPVLVLTPYLAWRYRYKNSRARYTPDWRFSWPLDGVIWGIPLAIVIVLSVWLVNNSNKLDPYKPLNSGNPPLRLQVIGYDWKWLFIYPDLGIASVGKLAFPADRPLAVDLTSNTVLQSFFIPSLGSQIYAMAGMTTHLHLLASRRGDFLGENLQYNGTDFHREKFTAVAMTPEAFDDWVQETKSQGIPLTAEAYKAIEKRSTLNQTCDDLGRSCSARPVLSFRSVEPGLFAAVVHSYHGGPAPFQTKHPQTASSLEAICAPSGAPFQGARC
jgi:cytochrome o ubiquinol oxidase subunit II